jgi:hypothetical protein
MKHKLTKSDLKKRLSDFGFKEGQEIELPSEKAKTDEQSAEEPSPPTGGSNPPGDKNKPDKP